jgi:hypothetical protein
LVVAQQCATKHGVKKKCLSDFLDKIWFSIKKIKKIQEFFGF